jgi:hypothetical protein
VTTTSGEAGSSPITAVFGVAMFLFFLLLASQVLLHLYATSIVTSAAFATATRVAAEDVGCGPGGATAEQIARSRLGGYGQRADLVVGCAVDGEDTVVTIQAPSPARGLSTVGYGLSLDAIERTARVRTEEFQT